MEEDIVIASNLTLHLHESAMPIMVHGCGCSPNCRLLTWSRGFGDIRIGKYYMSAVIAMRNNQKFDSTLLRFEGSDIYMFTPNAGIGTLLNSRGEKVVF